MGETEAERTKAEGLYCGLLGARPDEDKRAALRELQASQWEYITALAARHGTASLLYHRLHTLDAEALVPQAAYRSLRNQYYVTAAQNTHLYHQFSEIVRAMDEVDIPIIGLKGVYLAERLYGNIALRPMDDIDILVRRSDLLQVARHLCRLGYQPKRRFWVDLECAAYHQVPTFQQEDRFDVDVHWHLVRPQGPLKIDVEGLWKRARPFTTVDAKAMSLAPEDLLLHLCIHADQRRFAGGLRDYCDVLFVLTSGDYEINWAEFQSRSSAWRADGAVRRTLDIVKEMLGAPLPEELYDGQRAQELDGSSTAKISSRIFEEPTSYVPANGSAIVRKLLRSYRYAGASLRSIFPRAEIMANLYDVPDREVLVYPYYFLRLKELLVREGTGLWRTIRGDDRLLVE